MLLTYERGDSSRPRGHALLYFRSWGNPSAVFATYLIVPPIAVEISKYIPPMFAAQLQGMGAGGISVFPYPPIPEMVEDQRLLERLATARDDDLISGGSVDTSSPERLLQASAEAAQQYLQGFNSYMASSPSLEEPEVPAISESSASLDMDDLMYSLMGERDRLTELAKRIGQMRYAVGTGDSELRASAEADVKRLGGYLPEKYRVAEMVLGAGRPGSQGDRLTQLYLDRAYRLVDEDYEFVAKLDAEIKQAKDEGTGEG